MSEAYFHVIHMSMRLPFPSPPEVLREPLQVRRLDRTRLQIQRRRQTGRDPGDEVCPPRRLARHQLFVGIGVKAD